MQTERTILCGGVKPQIDESDSSPLALNSWELVGPTNVWLEIEDMHEKLWRDMSPKFQDLLEIAAYVYSADAAIPRGERAVTNDVDTFGAHWRRRLDFHIPVRELDFWNSKEAQAALRDTLDFLSDDYYSFKFYGAQGAPPVQRFFKLETGNAPSSRPERVVLFSGGLDSLAGAVEYGCGEQRKVLLVNHRSTDKFCRRHETLTKALIEKAKPVPMSQVRVLINKAKHLGAEYTQRARSFLYASMGAAVTRMMELDEMTFFENGVVSLNLPVCAQVAGGRATRTTHPKVIRSMERLLRLVAERDGFRLVTPFLGDTKADVIQRIKNLNCGELIGMSRSCAETMHRSNEQPHCGVCSQCIDRRVAVIAADAERFDPLPGYAVDVFTASLPKDAHKIMAASYIERANEVGKFKTTGQFIGAFPEVLRALRHMDGEPTGVAGRVLKLYQRHATEVTTALDLMTVRHAKAIRERKLPADCLLRIMLDARSVEVLPVVAGEPVASSNGSPESLLKEIHRDVLAGRAETREGLGKVEAGMQAVAEGSFELRKQNEELRQFHKDGYFKFVLRVNREDFVAFAAIMALGNRKAAAEYLEIPIRTFYDRVNKWACGDKEHQMMARYIEWRKTSDQHLTVSLNESLQSGESGGKAENPDTLRAVLEKMKERDTKSYPEILRDILEALQQQNPKNWDSVRTEVIELIKEEIPQ